MLFKLHTHLGEFVIGNTSYEGVRKAEKGYISNAIKNNIPIRSMLFCYSPIYPISIKQALAKIKEYNRGKERKRCRKCKDFYYDNQWRAFLCVICGASKERKE